MKSNYFAILDDKGKVSNLVAAFPEKESSNNNEIPLYEDEYYMLKSCVGNFELAFRLLTRIQEVVEGKLIR